MSSLFRSVNRVNRSVLNVMRFRNQLVFYRSMCVALGSFRTEKLLLPLTTGKQFYKEYGHGTFSDKQDLNATGDLDGVLTAENYLSEKLSSDKILTNEDWDAVRDDLIDNAVTNVLNVGDFTPRFLPHLLNVGDSNSRMKLVTRINCDATIFGFVRRLGDVSIGISYYNYLTRSITDIHMHHLNSLFRVINESQIKEEHEDFIINICEMVLNKGFGQVLPQVYWEALQALASTRKWASALDLVEGISSEDPSDATVLTKVYANLALKVYSEGKYDVMWSLLESPKFHNDIIEIRYNVQKTITDTHNKVFFNWIDHCEDLRKTSGEEKADLELEKLFEYFQKVSLFMDDQVVEKLQKYYSTSTNLELSLSQIHRRTGECFNCGTVIPDNSLEPLQFEMLKDAVVKNVLAGGDLFRNTNPEEMMNFMEMLQNSEQIDIVVDGQNVALQGTKVVKGQLGVKGFGKLEKQNSKRLLDVVKHLEEMGKSILIIHRTSMRNYPDFRAISSRAKCILLDKVTQDDPYMIIAALHNGNDCLLLTNDLLRQHNAKLCEKSLKLGKLFASWQLLHQMRIPWINNSGKESFQPVFTIPVKHKIEACKSSDDWHIPVREEKTSDKLSFMAPSQWICIGRRDRLKTMTNEVKIIAKSKHVKRKSKKAEAGNFGAEKSIKSTNVELKQTGTGEIDVLLKTLDKFKKPVKS